MAISRRTFLRPGCRGRPRCCRRWAHRPARVVQRQATTTRPCTPRAAFPKPGNPKVAVVNAASYDTDLQATVKQVLDPSGADVSGKTVLLKPNLVEFDGRHGDQHRPSARAHDSARAAPDGGPLRWTVGEGPGHRRDTEYVVRTSGLLDVVRDVDAPFTDLNTAGVVRQALNSFLHATRRDLAATAHRASRRRDLDAEDEDSSLGRGDALDEELLRLHAGPRVTGGRRTCCTGRASSRRSSTCPRPCTPVQQIVDGMVAMEGDGPIKGTPKDMGVLVFGTDMVATNTTSARLMGFDPERFSAICTRPGRSSVRCTSRRSSRWERTRKPSRRTSRCCRCSPASRSVPRRRERGAGDRRRPDGRVRTGSARADCAPRPSRRDG